MRAGRHIWLPVLLMIICSDANAEVVKIGPCAEPAEVYRVSSESGWRLTHIGHFAGRWAVLFSNRKASQMWIFHDDLLCVLDPSLLHRFTWTPTREKPI